MLLGTEFVFYSLYAEYRVVLVDRIYNFSVSPYDDRYLLHLQCKFL